jgi:hypothetical protein
MATCRTITEVRDAARDDAGNDPPLTQDDADHVAAIRAPHLADKGAAA